MSQKGNRQTKRAHGSAGSQKKTPWLPLLGGVVVVAVVATVVLNGLRSPKPANASLASTTAPTPTTAVSASVPTGGSASSSTANANPGASGQKAPVNDPSGAPKTAVTAKDGVISLPVADFSDSTARYYTTQVGGKTIPFFVMKSSDGVIRAAFDACDVCYQAKKGYHQEGDEMVCNNCGTRFPSSKINVVSGGCNPGPLERQVQGDQLLIKVSDLQAGARYF